MTEQPVLTAKSISKSFGSLKIIDDVSLDIYPGKMISIVGASGAGKSTLLHILGSLEKPDLGEISIQGMPLTKMNERGLANFRNQQLGFVFQFHHLLPEFSALENVCMPAWIAQKKDRAAKDDALQLLQWMGLENRAHHKPSQLSGGEQQRVAVARALINKPAIVFADEPTGNLDSKNAADLHQLFHKLQQELNQTFLIVTHNPELASICDTRWIMRDGRLYTD